VVGEGVDNDDDDDGEEDVIFTRPRKNPLKSFQTTV